ncbi:MAG: DUF1801 domain-containing protein, partial [Pseudomonadota bacterium]
VLGAVTPDARRDEGLRLARLFQRVTGWAPRHWGRGLIGYGSYHYRYDSGREGDFLATGFSMRAKEISLHILPGYSAFPEIAARLGKHRRGKSCWYIKSLSAIDEAALEDLIRAGLEDLSSQFEVSAS